MYLNLSSEPNTAPLIDFGESNGETTPSSQEMSERMASQFGGMSMTVCAFGVYQCVLKLIRA